MIKLGVLLNGQFLIMELRVCPNVWLRLAIGDPMILGVASFSFDVFKCFTNLIGAKPLNLLIPGPPG